MAEQIPFSIMAEIFMKLGSSTVQKIGSALDLKNELAKVEETLRTIQAVLLDAEEQQQTNHVVKNWVTSLKDVVYVVDDLLDDFASHRLQRRGLARQVSDFCSSSNQLAFRLKMSRRVRRIEESLDRIANNISKFNFISQDITDGRVRNRGRETHSFVLTSETVGRVEDKKEIIKSLMSSDSEENLSVVAIVGIGGLGKTTLAQLVYNDKRVVEFFELRIWICVLNYFDEKILVKKILESLIEGVVGNLELNVLKDLLHKKLRQKRYLLVLDDVWSDDFQRWDSLRILLMVGAKGSKIVVTTRNSSVASTMGCSCSFKLKGLEENQCWNLFSKLAFRREQANVHPELEEIGKEIVKMCNGVPLVIKTLGAALQSKTEKSQWLSIKTNENLLSLRDGNDSVSSVLKLSYDNLPIHLKQCFAYCALFPKNYEIEKKLLVQLWMAQGYIQPLDENVGDQYFEELLSRSLLEEVENDAYNNVSSCKMHDLIHDLARSVGSETFILGNDAEEILERVHHVSWSKPLNNGRKALKVKHIRTFLKLHTYEDDSSIVSSLISNFKNLRVLSLSKFNIRKVSKSLGKLNHLRYLDLSYNHFNALPNSITRLNNLQTLKLVGCEYLKEFPKDTRKLVNLRHLEDNGCRSLTHVPCGIRELTSLERLPLFVVGDRKGWFKDDRQIGKLSELEGLNNLRGKLRIEKLENVRDVVEESREANLRGKKYVQSLGLKWQDPRAQSGEDAESLIESLQPHPNLKELSVEGYGGVRFPSWMKNYGLSDLSLPNLITINLERCSGCQILPSFAELPHLKSLELDGMEKVEYMECSSEGPFFPSLQYLKLNLMPELKEFWRRDSPTEPCPSFPCLSELTIWGCFNLTSVALPSSPLLSQLDIKFCDKLASLELRSSPRLSSLEIWVSPKLTFLKVPSLTCLKTLKLLGVKEELLRRMLFTASSLESLSIAVVDDMRTLPDELLQHVSTLQTLNIWNCPNFTAFPHWIGGFSSLRMLKIYKCPKLTSLPEEMPSLNSLQRTVVSDCLNLEKSGQEETVEDRPQIDFIDERMNEIGFHVRFYLL